MRSAPCPPARPPTPWSRWGSASPARCATRSSAASPTTRTVAAYLSGEGSFTRSTDLLRLSLTTDEDPVVRAAAAVALGRMGRPADVAVLLDGTTGAQPSELRRACAAALGDLGDPQAVDGLRDLLADPDPRLAEIAATVAPQARPGRPHRAGQRPHERLDRDRPRRRPAAGEPVVSWDGFVDGLRATVVWLMDVTSMPILVYFTVINLSYLVLIVLAASTSGPSTGAVRRSSRPSAAP